MLVDPDPTLVDPMLVDLTLVEPTLVVPTLVDPMLVDPMLVDPMLVDPMLVHLTPVSTQAPTVMRALTRVWLMVDPTRATSMPGSMAVSTRASTVAQ